ncbi:hypothetical protein [Granulicella rosea]|uniref:hypothetical protein n=1 Tax=Granulicella rosea TaxID=474952 RepID=UPI00115D4461|nr:hypothetical protein [Granulicella rosea]
MLSSRALVLHHFWAIATAKVYPFDGHIVSHGDVPLLTSDLVVLCHTIPETMRQDWIDSIRSKQPALLIVKMNGFDAGPHGGADATVATDSGPGGLVSTIYELLTERGLVSRDWPDPAYLLGSVAGPVH